MTKAEYLEVMKLMGIDGKDIYGNKYIFADGKVIVSGNIPRNMIQELVLEDNSLKNFMEQLSPKDGNKKILPKFILYSKEELIFFLLALEDFSLKEKTGLIGNSKDQLQDILSEVLKTLINKAKLDSSVILWVKNNPKIRDLNIATLERMNKRPLFKTKKSVYEQDFNHNIRRNIDSFDCSVNPYLLSENIFKNISEIVNDVFISIDISDNEDVSFEVISKYTLNRVKYSRTSNVLLFEVTYTEHDDSVIKFTHKYTEDGEIIVVDENNKKMMYNLMTGKIKVKGIEEPDKDNKYKEKLYQFMLTASVYASSVTEENMLKQKSLSKRFI